MNSFLAMVVANLKMTVRNRQAIFWNLAFPAIFILIFGAIFGREVGDTLMGRPRTRGRIWYPEEPTDADVLRLCDTEGLELERYEETLGGLNTFICAPRRHADVGHNHIGPLCVNRDEQRVQVVADGGDLEVRPCLEQPPDPLANEIVILGEHEPDRHKTRIRR